MPPPVPPAPSRGAIPRSLVEEVLSIQDAQALEIQPGIIRDVAGNHLREGHHVVVAGAPDQFRKVSSKPTISFSLLRAKRSSR